MKLILKIKPQDKVIDSMPQDEINRTPVLLGLDAQGTNGEVEFLARRSISVPSG